ncbi:MAG TPA: Type 1 glutamine amidotransferase-like domain-containing protein [Blastocatellia bacterium]|nr:Type 1 glutamine amidotransferase-like domain-containing protein [Blastocatellia bacterium]
MRYVRLIAVIVAAVTATAGPSAPSHFDKKVWWPVSGTVILAGGGFKQKAANDLVDRLIASAGGPDAQIVVIPTASVTIPTLPATGPQPANIDAIRHHLESRGAKHITFLHTLDRKVADSDSFVKALRSANGVFITGGASRILDQTYHGTLVEKELKALLKRGGVIAGDSAGAITIGCFWIDYVPKEDAYGRSTDGLCLLPDVTVTPHVQNVDGDERLQEVFKYIAGHPAIGINIQESTFLILHGGVAEVGGTGGVSIFNPTKDKTKPYIKLSSGQKLDLDK